MKKVYANENSKFHQASDKKTKPFFKKPIIWLEIILIYFENSKPNKRQFQNRFCIFEQFPGKILKKILHRTFLFKIS
jgi:hypothetical protein